MNPEFSYFPQLWLLEWGCKSLKNVTKGLRYVKEGGISPRKAGLLWGLRMKKSTLQVRLNRRVTFDRRIEVPSPSFFKNKKEMKGKSRLQIGWLSLQTAASACPRMPSLISEKVPTQGSKNYQELLELYQVTPARVPHLTPVIRYVLVHNARLYFWNRSPDHLVSAREAYKSLACRNLCTITLLLLCPDTRPTVRILGSLRVAAPSPRQRKTERGSPLPPFFLCRGEGAATRRLDTGQHRSSAKILILRWKQRQKS